MSHELRCTSYQGSVFDQLLLEGPVNVCGADQVDPRWKATDVNRASAIEYRALEHTLANGVVDVQMCALQFTQVDRDQR